MTVVALIALCVAVAWIINGLHAEGMRNLAAMKQREQASSCYPRPAYRIIDVGRDAS